LEKGSKRICRRTGHNCKKDSKRESPLTGETNQNHKAKNHPTIHIWRKMGRVKRRKKGAIRTGKKTTAAGATMFHQKRESSSPRRGGGESHHLKQGGEEENHEISIRAAPERSKIPNRLRVKITVNRTDRKRREGSGQSTREKKNRDDKKQRKTRLTIGTNWKNLFEKDSGEEARRG